VACSRVQFAFTFYFVCRYSISNYTLPLIFVSLPNLKPAYNSTASLCKVKIINERNNMDVAKCADIDIVGKHRILSFLQFIMTLCYFIRMWQQYGGWWWLKLKIQLLRHNTDVSEVPGFTKLSVTIYQSWWRDASQGFYLHCNLWKWHKPYCDAMQYLDMYGCVICSTLKITSFTLPYLSTQLFTISFSGMPVWCRICSKSTGCITNVHKRHIMCLMRQTNHSWFKPNTLKTKINPLYIQIFC